MIPTAPELLRRWQAEGPRPRTLQSVLEWVAWALRGQQAAEAVRVLRELLALHEHPVLWGYLAQAETAAGNPAKAAEALVHHLRLEPSPSPAVWVAAVDAYVEAKKPNRAKALIEHAPGGDLKAFLRQRLKQDTGRAPRPKAPKTMKALAKLERDALMQVLGRVPLETVALATAGEVASVRDAVLDCFSGGPKRRLESLLARSGKASPAERAGARKALLAGSG